MRVTLWCLGKHRKCVTYDRFFTILLLKRPRKLHEGFIVSTVIPFVCPNYVIHPSIHAVTILKHRRADWAAGQQALTSPVRAGVAGPSALRISNFLRKS